MCSRLFSLPSWLPLAVSAVQAGLIRTDSTDYFIEPLEWGQQEMEASGRTHVVYRRDVIQPAWTEPLGDLHNEGRLRAGPPTLPPSTPPGCFYVTSGLSFSTPGLGLPICIMGLGCVAHVPAEKAHWVLGPIVAGWSWGPEEQLEPPELWSLGLPNLCGAQHCCARLFLHQGRWLNGCS